MRTAAAQVKDAKFPQHFLVNEWTEVVDAQQLASWEAYRDAPRLGRKTRLGDKQRLVLWSIFEAVGAGLRDRKMVTWAHIFGRLEVPIAAGLTLGARVDSEFSGNVIQVAVTARLRYRF